MSSAGGQVWVIQKPPRRFSSAQWKFWFCGWALLATMTMAATASNLDTGSPLGFFTNVADRLLMSQFNLDTTRIQIYPTNQYTPAVHRLLQLAANVYEATSTNAYPSVFRPLFSRDADGLGTNLFISGFTNVASVTGPADSQLFLPVDASALATTNIPVVNLPVNVYGIPWIVGVRKGLPNFNEFAMESAFQLFRKLQVTRPSTNSPVSDYQYNQMFILSLTNQLGVECWNSYTNPFTDPVTIYVTDNQMVTLTNDEGLSTNISISLISGFLQIPNSTVSNWPGYNPYGSGAAVLSTPASFQIPLITNVAVRPLSLYRFNMSGSPYLTTNLALPFESNVVINGNLYPQPHWYLTTSNNLRVIIMDTAVSPYHIIDYVQLSGPDSSRDLSSEIVKEYDTAARVDGNDMWNPTNQSGIPIGLISQIQVSLGDLPPPLNWKNRNSTQVHNEIDGFRAFFGMSPYYGDVGYQQAVAEARMTNSILVPYTPIAIVVQHISWQANDPLVHYTASDLNWSGASILNRVADNLTNENLGRLNQHYMPWGGNPLIFNADANPYNLAIKDPLVRRSDDWDFPTNESLSGEWLGRVHRGTPWQTIYLKASDVLHGTQVIGGVTNYIGNNIWEQWTGDAQLTHGQYSDAIAMAPVQDWHLASLLAYLMNTNHLQCLFSVNNPNSNAWLGLLNGLAALTNSAPDNQIAFGDAPQFDPLVISSNSPQASAMANTIQLARASQPGGYFRDVGDILAIPELSEQSPFLDWNDVTQQEYGISDEAYEKIPSQLLPLLRADSIGSIASLNGQITAHFTGYDDHAYAVEVSSNLAHWTGLSTNLSMNGGFSVTNSAPTDAGPKFYRSRLVQ